MEATIFNISPEKNIISFDNKKSFKNNNKISLK